MARSCGRALCTARPEGSVLPYPSATDPRGSSAVPLVSGSPVVDTGWGDAPEEGCTCSPLLVDATAPLRIVTACGLECLTIIGTSKIRTYTQVGIRGPGRASPDPHYGSLLHLPPPSKSRDLTSTCDSLENLSSAYFSVKSHDDPALH